MKPDLKRIEAALQQMDVHTVEQSLFSEPWTTAAHLSLPFYSADDNIAVEEAITEPLSMPFATPPSANSAWNLPVNAALSVSLLQELQTTVGGWQTVLQTMTQQIQAIYAEGPMVDGWIKTEENGGGYQLCGISEAGQPWVRDCPAEQVPDVSLAIARYQRFQQILSRKRKLESRLAQLTEVLIELHGQVLDSDP
ncbi:hypothetical protein JOY44_02295 [Phormidium sp. CLA17]|uniref:hypothetical protein n=1 Tax=Leptolyngbya sp. Cla-17 TaxID=2803751 RepID=UPI001491E511|nr:hypothetical protein [Leptolyngbya sp. Cla-17]MBM0740456.1 hypothetical protein [Leptolyngbya sp. Cla-17]